MEILRMPENSEYRVDPSGYAKSKIEIERALVEMDVAGKVSAVNARLYAFFGPHLSLKDHFAIGNFMDDGLSGSAITVRGNPSTVRSYMYPTNLVEAILALIPATQVKNLSIGSDQPITIEKLANIFSSYFGKLRVEHREFVGPASNYVPETVHLKELVGDSVFVELEEGIMRWEKWLNNKTFSTRVV